VRIFDTLPFGEREFERSQGQLAYEAAQPIVERLINEGHEAWAMTKLIADDTMLTAPVRRAALNIVMKRVSQSGSGQGR